MLFACLFLYRQSARLPAKPWRRKIGIETVNLHSTLYKRCNNHPHLMMDPDPGPQQQVTMSLSRSTRMAQSLLTSTAKRFQRIALSVITKSTSSSLTSRGSNKCWTSTENSNRCKSRCSNSSTRTVVLKTMARAEQSDTRIT